MDRTGIERVMATVRHLSRPPIVEAVLDFRTRLPAGLNSEALDAAASEVSVDYPTRKQQWMIEGSFAFAIEGDQPVSSSSRRPNGFVYHSKDGKQVAQFRLDGFTFSRLAPYTSWDEVVPEAFRLWNIYRRVAQPEGLFRVGVRYINRIRLPEAPRELNDLLTSAPQVPPGLPQTVMGFLAQVLVPLDMPSTKANIIQALGALPAAPPGFLLLDIDVIREEELDVADDILRPIFERLRDFKNKAFFNSLKDDLLREFE